MVTHRSHSKPPVPSVRVKPKQLLILAALVLILYVVVPQIGAFRSSLALLTNAAVKWVIVGGLCYLATSLASVGVYKALLSGRLPFVKTLLVEYGSSFANRLLPAGVGAVGVNYIFFKKQRYSTAAAVAAVTVNNMLGFVGHALLLVLVIVFVPRAWHTFNFPVKLSGSVVVLVGAGVIAVLIAVVVRYFKTRLGGVLTQTLIQLRNYERQPQRIGVALIFSMTITLLHSLALWMSARALHVDLSLAQAIIVLGIGVGVGAIIPSPGGLGGAEAGLLAGLLACHVAAGEAVAVAILYRLLTYWLGFAVGTVAFVWCEKRAYL